MHVCQIICAWDWKWYRSCNVSSISHVFPSGCCQTCHKLHLAWQKHDPGPKVCPLFILNVLLFTVHIILSHAIPNYLLPVINLSYVCFRTAILSKIVALESLNPTMSPASSVLISGSWALLYQASGSYGKLEIHIIRIPVLKLSRLKGNTRNITAVMLTYGILTCIHHAILAFNQNAFPRYH